MNSSITSPCILVCSIDDATGYCHGCGRTRDEIGAWTLYSSEQRQEITQTLDDRLKTIKKRPRRETRRQRMMRERRQAASNEG